MKAEGLKLACKYCCAGCDRVKLKRVGAHLLAFLRNQTPERSECAFMIKVLKNLGPYNDYCLIRELKGETSPFETTVVRAYWLGDKSLEPDNLNHNFATLEQFKTIKTREHWPDWIIEGILDCCVSFGEVIEVGQEKAKVLNHRLLYKEGKIILGTKTREVDRNFIDGLKKGDLVSIHWGIAREKISQEQTETLEVITKKALKTLQMA